jgi:hypothetical protein
MCSDAIPGSDPLRAILAPAHVGAIADAYPRQQRFVADIAEILQRRLRPPASLLVLFADLMHRFDAISEHPDIAGRTGAYLGPRTVGFTYSVIAPPRQRFQTDLHAALHEAALGLHMSQGTMDELREYLRRYGVTHYSMHSCGDIFRDARLPPLADDQAILAMERFRSALDARGVGTVRVPASAGIPGATLDWGNADRAAHDRIERILRGLPAEIDPVASADRELDTRLGQLTRHPGIRWNA